MSPAPTAIAVIVGGAPSSAEGRAVGVELLDLAEQLQHLGRDGDGDGDGSRASSRSSMSPAPAPSSPSSTADQLHAARPRPLLPKEYCGG